MARSTSLFILLAALVIQAVLACSGITPGLYVIANEYKLLTPGPTPHIYPPVDVQAHLWNTGEYGVNWLIEPVEGGYTIRESHNKFAYALVEKDGEPYFSVHQAPGVWAVNPAGDGLFTIGYPGEDLLLTADFAKRLATLRPADGSSLQRWSLHKIHPDRNLYPNRFQHIL